MKQEFGTLAEEQEIYKENILEHYKYPLNKKELKHCTVQHKEYNPLCGDEITVYLNIDKGKIKSVGWTGQGCAISQAAMSMLSEKIVGLSIEEVKKITKEDIVMMLGIPITYQRMKCATLSIEAVCKGIENVRA